MRIKILTQSIDKDIETLKSNNYAIVNDKETHILIDASKKQLIGKKNDTITPIDPTNVVYVESFGNDIFCHTLQGTYKIEHRLYQYIEKYSNLGFVQINKSYVLNINFIKSIYPLINMRYIVKLTNDKELLVTRTYLKAFKLKIKGGKL